MHRRVSIIAGVFVAALVACLAVTGPAAAEEAPKIFAKSCSPCHGKEGQPNAVFVKQGVRSFKDAEWQQVTKDEQIATSIREGRKGTMMAGFAKQFSDEEIKGLVAYIRELGPDKK